MTCEVLTAGAATAIGLLAEVSEALDSDLEHLSAEDWHTRVILDWSVHDVVAHVAAVHSLAAKRLGGPVDDHISDLDLLDATDRFVGLQRDRNPDETRELWRTSVDCLRRCAADVESTATKWVWGDTTTDGLIIDRAFETWIHANDIRRGTNRSSLDPSGEHFRVLCNFGVANWPAVLDLHGRDHRGVITVNLSGPGGGTQTMVVGGADDQAANGLRFTLNCAARDLCLLMGDRLDPVDFAYTLRGADDDARALVNDLVLYGSTFARP